jgi:hypothetical protein
MPERPKPPEFSGLERSFPRELGQLFATIFDNSCWA